MIKIAVVGTGLIGMQHLRAMEHTDACQLCALCDVNEEKVKELATQYQVPYFTDYHDMPGQVEADAVILNLPHYLHCESTVFFLEHGMHVLVEKPMANTVEECERMIAAAEKSGKKLAVGHVQRYFRVNSWLKKAVEEERFGKLCMITGKRSINYFAESRPGWFLKKNAAGGGIGMNYGAHALDTLFYITGERKAEIISGYGNLKTDHDIEGHMQYMLKFPSGLSMCQTLSGYNESGHEVVYYFTDGVLKVEDAARLYQYVDSRWVQIAIEEDELIMERQMADFCRFLEGKPSMICDAQCGRDVIAALENVYKI
ncbi:MAG: Gfo/Idh/MocA family oxidoreductase [Lachnospiraceae bacterium]|nr:Gfo/Idh/MocA family oxidoreductase [Lachnospiraceae bacterium]